MKFEFEEVTLEKAGLGHGVQCSHCGDCYIIIRE